MIERPGLEHTYTLIADTSVGLTPSLLHGSLLKLLEDSRGTCFISSMILGPVILISQDSLFVRKDVSERSIFSYIPSEYNQ